MKASFWIGLGLGVVSGACIITGNDKLREMLNKGKEKMEDKITQL